MGDKLDYRGIVFARSKGYCEKCGNQLGDNFALHHRKLKSRGGKDAVSNFLALHHGCHNGFTDSVHFNPKKAEEMGYMVPSWASPEDWLLTLPDGRIVALAEDGTYKEGKNE